MTDQVQSPPLRCRGPRQQDVTAAIARLLFARHPLTGAKADRLKDLAKLLEGEKENATDKAIAALLQAGETDLAKILDAATRRGCGFDFSPVFAAGPQDGAEHTYKCPDCGLEGWYTAPVAPG